MRLEWKTTALCLLARLVFCLGQNCSDEITHHVNVDINGASVASTTDLRQSSVPCRTSILWDITTTDRSSQLIAIEILEIPSPPNGQFALFYASPTEFLPVLMGVHRLFFAEVGQESKLRLEYSGTASELPDGEFGLVTVARLTLVNETDCGEHFLCHWLCLDSSVVCDGHVHCEEQALDEINCEECGQTYFDLMNGQPVGLTAPTPLSLLICVWQFSAPPQTKILLRFLEYTSHWTSIFAVTKTVVTDGLEATHPDVLLYRGFSSFATVPKVRVYRRESVWVTFGHLADQPDNVYDTVIRFEVSPVNETAVACTDSEFLCDTGIQCITGSMRCDGLPDCEDYSDELGCSPSCGPNELSCVADSQDTCVMDSFICDSAKQCDNFLDEINCASQCGDQYIHLQPNSTRTLASPNAPSAHPLRVICVWFVTAPPGTRILVHTVRINLNYGANLTVGDGPKVNTSRIIWQRQGGTAPSHVASQAHEIWVAIEDLTMSGFLVSGSPVSVTDAHFVLELSVLEESVTCSSGDQFACEDGYQCINASNVCDGIIHCWDHSDEMSSCGGQCSSTAIQCVDSDGLDACLDQEMVCDGRADCLNYMDETLCSNICGRRYISLTEYLGSPYNISSPESGYPPRTDCLWIFSTAPGLRILMDVIHQSVGEQDFFQFGEGTDPTNRSTSVGYLNGNNAPFATLFEGNGLWVTFTALLAGTSSETSPGSFLYQFRSFNDSSTCGDGLFQCVSTGICIASSRFCDGIFSCDDSSDETGCDHCGGVSVINATNGQPYVLGVNYDLDEVNFPFGRSCVWYVSASAGYRIRVTFLEHSTSDGNHLYFGHGAVLEENAETSPTTGRYARRFITSETSDMWIMFASENSAADQFTLEIQQFRPMECSEFEFACPSGLACIPVNEVCDGFPQCPLQGDEIGCGSCSVDEYTCPEGQCVNVQWGICNAQADCADLWDELNCYPCGESSLVLNNTTAPSLTLTSVDYPSMYPNYALCVWLVTVDASSVIGLRFSAFDLEPHYDTLTIGNGLAPSNQASVVAQLSGSLPGVRVMTIQHMAWLSFSTDYSITKGGFSVRITQESVGGLCSPGEFSCGDTLSGLICLSVDSVCDGFTTCLDGADENSCGECGAQFIYILEDPVLLQSPLYPNPYPNDITCTWQIVGERDTLVYLRILDFALEDGFDYLTISSDDDVFELTGESPSRRTLVWDPHVPISLELVTDRTTAQRGFSIMIAHVANFTGVFGELPVLCDGDEFHCGDGMCVTNASFCNGYLDCLNYKDEADCNDVFCPGSYKCDNFNRNLADPSPTHLSHGSQTTPSPFDTFNPSGMHFSSSGSSSSGSSSSGSSSDSGYLSQAQCIPRAQVCDGWQDCPEADDETECDRKRCPAGCLCSYSGVDLVVSCEHGWNATTLSDLALTTHTLHLSGIDLNMLEEGTFKAITNLKVLSLRNNGITEIRERTFDGLDSLLWLDLSNTSLTELQGSAMEELSSLRGITIFDVPLTKIKTDAFYGLSRMETLIIVRNTKGLPPLEIEEDAFRGLESVSALYVDDHRLCCFFSSSTDCKTLEPEPPLFMCSELMPKTILKVFMWILGISALVGNFFVMVWRCREKTEGRASRIVHSFLVFNLAVSDAFMGLYMLIIAGADAYFGERYFEVSTEWRSSVLCQTAGFISIVASEASVFFLTLISIDRFLSIVFPFSSYHLRPNSARIAACCVWIGTVIVSLVPTILASDTTSDLYGLSDVCIGLPLMTKVTRYETVDQKIDAGGVANITVSIPFPAESRASWFFSIALFLGVNLLCFSVILACYIAIFVRVKTSIKRVRRHKKRDDEVRMAIKMAAIVLTDFACWIPVIAMGILSQTRVVEIPTEAYAWIVVFILPINSSLNPYLYTISDFCSQQRRAAAVKKAELPMKNSNSENRISTISTNLTLATEADSKVGQS